MPSFTREQLRTFTTNSADFTAVVHTFTLVNNASTVAGFSMEGRNGKEIFKSGSITSLSNCSLVSGSNNVAFLIDSGSTATFTFTPTSTISQEDILMAAPNVKIIQPSSTTFKGVDLEIST